jgi:CDP-glucose 4,6-dehydratase
MGIRQGALDGLGQTMNIWEGKRVFVTGHTGFKGSWMALLLTRLGAKVWGYALDPPTEPNLFTVARVAEGLESRIADIRDVPTLDAAMAAFKPEVVFHMAAQPLVRDSYAIPVETYDVNVMGTVHVLEAVRKTAGVEATVVITSDKCYENRETMTPYREGDAMGGCDPYSSSKGCAELVTAAYGRSYFAPGMGRGSLASARAGNVIGGGDWAKDRIVCDLARGLIADEKVVIRRPDAIRPWQHVLEPLSGYLKVAEKLLGEGPLPWEGWNFGPDKNSEQTVGALASLICGLWGRPGALRIEPDPKALHEATLLKLDSTKAHTKLGWQPRWGFEEGVGRTVAWYKAYADGADMRGFTVAQIDAHLADQDAIASRRVPA